MAGRFAPIGVHLAMLLIMAGATLSACGSFKGSVNVPQGLNFVVGDVMTPNGFLSTPLQSFNTEVHVNRFYMDYYESGEVITVSLCPCFIFWFPFCFQLVAVQVLCFCGYQWHLWFKIFFLNGSDQDSKFQNWYRPIDYGIKIGNIVHTISLILKIPAISKQYYMVYSVSQNLIR